MSTESRESRESREFIPLLEQRHIVIDLETLDTSIDAVVLSIGYAWGTHKGYAASQVNLETASQLLRGRVAGDRGREREREREKEGEREERERGRERESQSERRGE